MYLENCIIYYSAQFLLQQWQANFAIHVTGVIWNLSHVWNDEVSVRVHHEGTTHQIVCSCDCRLTLKVMIDKNYLFLSPLQRTFVSGVVCHRNEACL